jgi:alpha-tubulin suppressor-like RCC1 family protein
LTSLWIWSNLPQYSVAELEEHKKAVKKVIEYRRKVSFHGLTGKFPYTFSGSFNTNQELQQQLEEIDEEITRRKSSSLLLENGSYLLLEDGSRLQLEEATITHVEPEITKEQLVSKDKMIALLQREIENVTNELEHEKTHSDNQRRVIKWMSGENGSLYTDDVEEDYDE